MDVDADDDNINNPSSDMILDEKTTAVKKNFYESLEERATKKKVEIPTLDGYETICRVLDECKSGETHTPEQRKWNAYYSSDRTVATSTITGAIPEGCKKEQMFAIIMGAHQH